MGPDTDQLRRTLAGVLSHTTVAAAVILGLGCEVNQIDHYLGPDGPRSSRLVGMTLQDSGGTLGALDRARKEILGFMEKAAAEKRVAVPASKIVLGLNCGGAGFLSGIHPKPAPGVCSDRLAGLRGTALVPAATAVFGGAGPPVRRSRARHGGA